MKYLTGLITVLIAIPIIFMASSFAGNINSLQPASAQETNGTTSFSAAGYTGQILTLPPSITQVPTGENESSIRPAIGSVNGGNWSFTVSNGGLENFTWNAAAYSLDGKIDGTASVIGLTDAYTLGSSSPSDPIELDGNSTSFAGTVDVEINGETAFEDVPAALYLLNGNIVSLILSQEETNGQFAVPLYGIVTSLTS